MFNTKQLTQAALLCSVASIFQLMPLFFSDLFTIFTLLSTIPIYLITKKNKELGIVAFFVTSTIVFFFNLQEFIIFTFLNGFVGVLYGLFSKYKYYAAIITGISLSFSILFVNYVIGIPLFGTPIPFKMIYLCFIILFALVYALIYYILLTYLTNKVPLIRKYLKN